jgi:hypothetical protein
MYTCVLYVRKPHLIKIITETLLSFTFSMTRSPNTYRNFWQLSPWQRTHNIWHTFQDYIYTTNTSNSRFTSLNLLHTSIFPYQNNIPNSEFRGYITDNFLLLPELAHCCCTHIHSHTHTHTHNSLSPNDIRNSKYHAKRSTVYQSGVSDWT